MDTATANSDGSRSDDALAGSSSTSQSTVLSDISCFKGEDVTFDGEELSASEKALVGFVRTAIERTESELSAMKLTAWKANRIRISADLNDSGYYDESHGSSIDPSTWLVPDGSNNGMKRARIVNLTASGLRTESEVPVIKLDSVATQPVQREWICIERNLNLNPDDDTDEIDYNAECGGSNNTQDQQDIMQPKNNEAFEMVCKYVMEEEKQLQEREGIEEASSAETPTWFTFQAIIKWTGAVGITAEDLERRYYDLIRKDLGNGKFKGNPLSVATRSEVMSSFYKHFCRRCYLYNCMCHGNYTNLTTSGKVPFQRPHFDENYCQKVKEDKRHPFKEKCGEHCYKPELAKLMKTEPSDSDAEGWTDDEIVIFLSAGKILYGNPCKLSAVIMSKSCIQVYKYWQLVKRNGDFDLNGINPRKKKRLRYIEPLKRFFTLSKKANLLLTMKGDQQPKPDDYPAYHPCFHPGETCDQADETCACKIGKLTCAKFCSCTADNYDCILFFPGCRCKARCGKSCECVIASRECDVDICGCAMKAVRYNPKAQLCNNTNLQLRQKGAKTTVAPSTIPAAGWGLFAAELIPTGTYVGEYVGELIKRQESERRDKNIYNRIGFTYLFSKDADHTIDGWKYGNKTRFINSAPPEKANLAPSSKTVYGDVRIGFYAVKEIKPGEELFFDYQSAINVQKDSQDNESMEKSIPRKIATRSKDFCQAGISNSDTNKVATAKKSIMQ